MHYLYIIGEALKLLISDIDNAKSFITRKSSYKKDSLAQLI